MLMCIPFNITILFLGIYPTDKLTQVCKKKKRKQNSVCVHGDTHYCAVLRVKNCYEQGNGYINLAQP